MEINGLFITTAKPKESIDISKCPTGFSVSANGHPIDLKDPAETRSLVCLLAKLLKKPVVKR